VEGSVFNVLEPLGIMCLRHSRLVDGRTSAFLMGLTQASRSTNLITMYILSGDLEVRKVAKLSLFLQSRATRGRH
jgi:hypothetical protein